MKPQWGFRAADRPSPQARIKSCFPHQTNNLRFFGGYLFTMDLTGLEGFGSEWTSMWNRNAWLRQSYGQNQTLSAPAWRNKSLSSLSSLFPVSEKTPGTSLQRAILISLESTPKPGRTVIECRAARFLCACCPGDKGRGPDTCVVPLTASFRTVLWRWLCLSSFRSCPGWSS